jgi:UDPglucose 6-dehydrogenase
MAAPQVRRITVLGTGYLGAVHAACLASLGFEVLGVDTDARQVAELSAGRVPFFEPGLGPLVEQGLRAGRLRFCTSYSDAARFGDVHFICVGTPPGPPGTGADVSQVLRCADELAPRLERSCLVVGKSTGPVGLAGELARRITAAAPAAERAELAWNPEFLREGHAVADTLHPDRIVAGVAGPRAERVLREIYGPLIAAGVPFLVTDYATAELAKTAANAFLATKVSFINAMAEVCQQAGADVLTLAEILGADERIGAGGLRPGIGFGGGCLPKDLHAFLARAAQLGTAESLAFLREVDAVNRRARARVVALAEELAGGSLDGQPVGVLGAAFKAGSDDIRESPALAVAVQLAARGARVTVYDPAAMPRAARAHPELEFAGSAVGAAAQARVLLVLTDWAEFRDADPEVLGKAAERRTVIDGRHVLDPARWRAAGWDYRAPGRPHAAAPP